MLEWKDFTAAKMLAPVGLDLVTLLAIIVKHDAAI